jgi:HlyD family secretion protein
MERILGARLLVVGLLVAASACRGGNDDATPISTAAVERRDIVVQAEATGVIEPINVVEVKSKASGQIVAMPVETGDQVRPGALLVQVDTRDVRNQYNQALADVRAAEASVQVQVAQRTRSEELNRAQIITAQEFEATALAYENARAQLARARANLDIAQQRLEDATVRAPIAGTIIEKTVALGQVITSATGNIAGGTTLLRMANLQQVRVRAMVTETDIGNVRPGQEVRVTVDAYPTRPFMGTVEKVEPQAVVVQSVTMFPVLVSVSNVEGLLMPGMNGEVSILVSERAGVLAVPNDAVRNPREAASVAAALGLDPDDVRRQLAAGRGGAPGPNGDVRVQISRGEIGPELVATSQQQAQGGGQRGGQVPEVSAQQCAAVDSVLRTKPELQRRLESMRARMQAGELDMQQARTESQAIYQELGVDGRVARACQMRAAQGGASAPAGGAQRQAGAARPQGAPAGDRVQSAPLQGGAFAATPAGRGRMGVVFVAVGNSFEARMVRLGVSNYDYTEVLSGVEEGEQVAMLAVVALQQQRAERMERMRGMTGGGVPGMTRQGR